MNDWHIYAKTIRLFAFNLYAKCFAFVYYQRNLEVVIIFSKSSCYNHDIILSFQEETRESAEDSGYKEVCLFVV